VCNYDSNLKIQWQPLPARKNDTQDCLRDSTFTPGEGFTLPPSLRVIRKSRGGKGERSES